MTAQLVEYGPEWSQKIEEYKEEFKSAGEDYDGLEGFTSLTMPLDSTSTFLYVTEDGKLLGLLNLRNGLSEEQLKIYGNAGFSIRPSMQRKGLAVQMLEDASFLCMILGIAPLRMTCLGDNEASKRTIEKLGGKLVDKHEIEGRVVWEYCTLEMEV